MSKSPIVMQQTDNASNIGEILQELSKIPISQELAWGNNCHEKQTHGTNLNQKLDG